MNTIIVFDFETTGVDPHTCQPVQLAAVAINSKTLEIKPNSEFKSDIQPIDFNTIAEDNIKFHAKNRKCGSEDIIARWKAAPQPQHVFDQFFKYVHNQNWKKTKWWAPVAAGHNILRFDMIILDRMLKEYGHDKDYFFHPRDCLDTMFMCLHWFESLDEPKSYSWDNLRPFFGFSEASKENAHDALQDVYDTAALLVRFLKLHRRYAEQVNFKGAFTNG